MLAVGNADAILIRYFDKQGKDYVLLIDAGHTDDSKKIENWIKDRYNRASIDLAICTHIDSDHIDGFIGLLDNVEIKEFWIHNPLELLCEASNNTCVDSLIKASLQMNESLMGLNHLISKIKALKIKCRNPFTMIEHRVIPIRVLGPTIEFYEKQIEKCRKKSISEIFGAYESINEGLDSRWENQSSVVIYNDENTKELYDEK